MRLKLRSFDSRLLDSASRQITLRAMENGASVRGPIPLPVRISRTTILVSPHKYKDARDQYEIRTYSRLIDIHGLDKQGVDHLSAFELPAGVHFKAETK